MMNAASMPMGFLRSLYFEQVKKNVADAKEKEAKEEQKKQEERLKAPGYDRADQRMQKVMINRYNARTKSNNKKNNNNYQQVRTPEISNFSSEDLEEALEELE